MATCSVIYRFFDDNEEKHYVSTSLDHQKLEEVVEKYKEKKEEVLAKDFIKYLNEYDPEAVEVVVKDFFF